MITRDVNAAGQLEHDVVIIGGGIYGACMLLEATRRGLSAVLLERDDFGGATSWNSLRIIHGGLRYLQSINIKRFVESVAERRWFLQMFADLVKPLPCLMPLYDEGVKRLPVMRAALAVNEWLGASRGIAAHGWERGRVLSERDAITLAPCVSMQGLKGAALWHDAVMVSCQRVIIEIIKWACSGGAWALNYVEAEDLVARGHAVAAVRAVDRVTGQRHDFAGDLVINCAGPWSPTVAGLLDREHRRLFQPSLAFNLLLDREALSTCALALAPRGKRRGKGQVYFLCPFRDRIIAGTAHVPWEGEPSQPRPTHEQVGHMLDDLNDAVPGLDAGDEDVLRVYSGLLPVRRAQTTTLATRAAIYDHGKLGGPRGLVSVSGVKFTTARRVAAQTLRKHARRKGRRRVELPSRRPGNRVTLDLVDWQAAQHARDIELVRDLERLVQEEAVVTLDDLLLRRTDWLADPRNTQRVTQRVQSLMPSLQQELPRADSHAPAAGRQMVSAGDRP